MKNVSKQIKWVCPKGCGNFRMLNMGVNLALCQNCGYIQMNPESSFGVRIDTNKQNQRML